MKTALVLMTALLPTTGHADIIQFATNLDVDRVDVMLNTRSHEPLSGQVRLDSLKTFFAGSPKVNIIMVLEDNAPQAPRHDDDAEFWHWWRVQVERAFPNTHHDYVVASESYGRRLAQELSAMFIPYDIQRRLNPIKGSDVREKLWERWDSILPTVRRHLGVSVTLFGQESVGKTTTARGLAKHWNFETWIHEWARPYLEFMGGDITVEQMLAIGHGQAALQRMSLQKFNHPVLIQDTDLFSTVGYYDIARWMSLPEDLVQQASALKSDRYYILNDNIPFEPDPIRYGGKRRESSMELWINVAERYGLDYVVVDAQYLGDRIDFISQDVERLFYQKNADLIDFFREEN